VELLETRHDGSRIFAVRLGQSISSDAPEAL
jgi:hypothetical protein